MLPFPAACESKKEKIQFIKCVNLNNYFFIFYTNLKYVYAQNIKKYIDLHSDSAINKLCN